jgi:hypothetical protein
MEQLSPPADRRALPRVAPDVPRFTLHQFDQLPETHREFLARWSARLETETAAGAPVAALKASIGLMAVTVMCERFLKEFYRLGRLARPTVYRVRRPLIVRLWRCLR